MRRSEVFGVLFYVLMYMILTLLSCSVRIIAQLGWMDPSTLPVDFKFPLEIYSWGLFAVTGYYSGIDFGIPSKFKLKTREDLEVKSINVLLIVVLLGLIVAETTFLCMKFGYELNIRVRGVMTTFKAVELPIKEVSLAFVMTLCFFITGNKTIRGEE